MEKEVFRYKSLKGGRLTPTPQIVSRTIPKTLSPIVAHKFRNKQNKITKKEVIEILDEFQATKQIIDPKHVHSNHEQTGVSPSLNSDKLKGHLYHRRNISSSSKVYLLLEDG